MLSGYDAEELSSIEAEDALADEFCEWVLSWQTVPAGGSTPGRVVSGARLEGLLGMGRIRIMSVMNNRLRGERGWRQANQTVRRAWLDNRERWLLMGLPELEVEEEERKRKKEAVALGAEAEVHDDDAPYAVAGDEGLQAISGVSDENIDTGSTPLAGSPREVEQGGEPDEDASQPDAELPEEDATQAIVPTDAPDATALTPVTPVDAPVAPAVSPTDEQAAGAMIGDVPLEEVDAFVNTPAGAGNAPAWGATVHRNLRRQCCALLPECHSTVYAGANAVNCLGRLIFHLQPPRQRSKGCPAWTCPVGRIRREHMRSRTQVLCTNEPLQPATHRRAQRIRVDESIHGLSPSVACAP